MATYRELQEQARKLLEQAETQRKQEIEAVLGLITQKLTDYEIGLEELFDHLKAAGFKARAGASRAVGRPAKGAAKVEAKFHNPATGETWSGRGRAPGWLREAESSGRSRDEFLVK